MMRLRPCLVRGVTDDTSTVVIPCVGVLGGPTPSPLAGLRAVEDLAA